MSFCYYSAYICHQRNYLTYKNVYWFRSRNKEDIEMANAINYQLSIVKKM